MTGGLPDRTCVVFGAGALGLGFLVIFMIGFATAAYPGEMGRQFMPFATLLVVVGFSAVRYVSASRY